MCPADEDSGKDADEAEATRVGSASATCSKEAIIMRPADRVKTSNRRCNAGKQMPRRWDDEDDDEEDDEKETEENAVKCKADANCELLRRVGLPGIWDASYFDPRFTDQADGTVSRKPRVVSVHEQRVSKKIFSRSQK